MKMDGWKTTFLLGWPIFRVYVSFGEGIYKPSILGVKHPPIFGSPEVTFGMDLTWWVQKRSNEIGMGPRGPFEALVTATSL